MKRDGTPERELLFLALGGSGEVGMNVNLYGCDGKWLMVDLGMTFSGNEYPGVDLVFADLEFIEERADNLVGLVLTHGHEDHIGAIPYFAEELGVPLYATPFTAGLVAHKLEEAGLSRTVDLRIIDEGNGPFQLGPFGLTYVPMAHSIAEANALLIETPYGRVFHSGDWKLDEDPIVGEPATQGQLDAIGKEGVLALVCDSTNAFNHEASGSEGAVHRGLLEEVQKHAGRRVVITTFASNIARLQTIGDVARETGRQICIAGRSIDRYLEVAQDTGYLADFPDPISIDEAMDLPRGDVLIVGTGGQGEPRAALSRIAEGTHPIKLTEGDVVIFSSRQIPGNEVPIGSMQNTLAERGIVMITDRQSMIHVSGHPGRPELQTLYRWLQPEILVPVHGEERHLAEQARLGLATGIPKAVVQKNGQVIRLAPGEPEKLMEVRTGRLLLDGDIIVPADGEAITTRRRLAQHGLVVVLLGKGSTVQVEAFGLPLDEDHDDFIAEAEADVVKAIAKAAKGAGRDDKALLEAARLAARQTARRWSGKNPQVKVLQVKF